jgi:hypothetical protein
MERKLRESQRSELPEAWKAAYERDRSGDAPYADPAPARRAAGWRSLAVPGVLLLALTRQFVLADFLVLLLTLGAIWALRVFRPSLRPAKPAGAYRRYPEFVRASYAWVLVGAGLGLLADLLPGQAGLGGASRHAVTVGFLATLIFAIGPRLLPAFLSGRELYSSALMAPVSGHSMTSLAH